VVSGLKSALRKLATKPIKYRDHLQIARLLGDLHASIVPGADNKHIGLLGQDGLEVFLREPVSPLTPPAFLDMVGKYDDVGVVAMVFDVDVAETVLVDVDGSKSPRLSR